MRKRTRAREIALQLLYQADIRHEDIEPIMDAFLDTQINSSGELEPAVVDFAKELVRGTLAYTENIDRIISLYAQNWQLERMAVIDRNIMRMACYELLYIDDIPPKVSINEAVDLAKKYGDIESGKFVNGILDRISKKEAKIK
jgi:transcription antitermination factor NusB